jgi:hypothetical protein
MIYSFCYNAPEGRTKQFLLRAPALAHVLPQWGVWGPGGCGGLSFDLAVVEGPRGSELRVSCSLAEKGATQQPVGAPRPGPFWALQRRDTSTSRDGFCMDLTKPPPDGTNQADPAHTSTREPAPAPAQLRGCV